MGGRAIATIFTIKEDFMISVGIDVSKGKSTVCMLNPYGERAGRACINDFEIR